MNASDIKAGMPECPHDCWEWEGTYQGNLPKVRYEGRMQQVAVVSYRMHVGPVKNGYHVWRTCGNSRCFNPKHLMSGTQKQHGKWVEKENDKIYQSNANVQAEDVNIDAYFHNLQRRQGLDGTDVVRYFGDLMRFDRFVAVWKMNREVFRYEIESEENDDEGNEPEGD